MKCPICEKGTLKRGKDQKNEIFLVRRNALTRERMKRVHSHATPFSRIKETMFGVYLGEFPAEICNKCSESFTKEKTTRAIEEAAKKKGVWGLGKMLRNSSGISGTEKSVKQISHEAKITKTGNSLAVRIPKEIADFLNLREGKEAYIHPEKDKLIIESA